jgi:hypothetical protein
MKTRMGFLFWIFASNFTVGCHLRQVSWIKLEWMFLCVFIFRNPHLAGCHSVVFLIY